MRKCEEANAWDQWMYGHKETLDPTTLKAPAEQRQYLEARLSGCFQDGVKAGKLIALGRLERGLAKVILETD